MIAGAERPLAGLRVLITRPAAQADGLCRLVAGAGGMAQGVPTIEIGPPADAESARRQLAAAGAGECVIFVSRNAVEFAARLAPDLRGLLAERAIFAAGAGTRRDLSRLGVQSTAPPPGTEGAEGLLGLEALGEPAVSGRQVLIVRGEGGRELLRTELARRGAQVRYAEVYSRRCPGASLLNEVWRHARPDIMVTTSNQGLENLVAMTDSGLRGDLFGTPLLVTSERARARAVELGFRGRIVCAPAADDAGLLGSLVKLAEEMRGG
jgi:uroporphyrinogen-III synthase